MNKIVRKFICNWIILTPCIFLQCKCNSPKKQIANKNQTRLDYIKGNLSDSSKHLLPRIDSIFKNNPNSKFPVVFDSILRKYVPDSLKYLLPILDTIYEDDQRFRETKDPKLFFYNKSKVQYLDSINLLKVIPIIESYGILSVKQIGMKGSQAIFMVLQHAPQVTQIKYFPIIQKAFDDKKINPGQYAIYCDRTAKYKNKMQTFGTQLMISGKGKGELYPVVDVDNLDKRRDSIGIGTIEKYMSRFGLSWNIYKYKNDLPSLKIKYKIID
jgi:hypothetical protein